MDLEGQYLGRVDISICSIALTRTRFLPPYYCEGCSGGWFGVPAGENLGGCGAKTIEACSAPLLKAHLFCLLSWV